jgi:hypothetical protein
MLTFQVIKLLTTAVHLTHPVIVDVISKGVGLAADDLLDVALAVIGDGVERCTTAVLLLGDVALVVGLGERVADGS